MIVAPVAVFVEHDPAWPHLFTIVSVCAWLFAVRRVTKRRWLRWLRDEFADEVNAKMDGIRRAAPFN